MIPETISAIASSVSAVVAMFLLRQLSLTRQQIQLAREGNEATVRWNRLSAAYALISATQLAESEREVYVALEQLQIKYISPCRAILVDRAD